MKVILLIPLTLLCVLLLAIPAPAMENEPDEFLGIPWGAVSPEKNFIGSGDMGGFEARRLEIGGSVTLYERPHEKVSIFGVKPLSPIAYFFHDSLGFARALMRFKGVENYQQMLKACVDQWGKPDEERRDVNQELGYDLAINIWQGERITVFLSYYYKKSEVGTLSLYLNDYLAEIREKEDAAK